VRARASEGLSEASVRGRGRNGYGAAQSHVTHTGERAARSTHGSLSLSVGGGGGDGSKDSVHRLRLEKVETHARHLAGSLVDGPHVHVAHGLLGGAARELVLRRVRRSHEHLRRGVGGRLELAEYLGGEVLEIDVGEKGAPLDASDRAGVELELRRTQEWVRTPEAFFISSSRASMTAASRKNFSATASLPSALKSPSPHA